MSLRGTALKKPTRSSFHSTSCSSLGLAQCLWRDFHSCGMLCTPGLSEYSVLAITGKAMDAISNSLLRKDCAYEIIVRPLANCFLRFRKTVPRGSGADLQKLQEYRLERCPGISSSIFCRHSSGEPSRRLNTEGSSHVLQRPRPSNGPTIQPASHFRSPDVSPERPPGQWQPPSFTAPSQRPVLPRFRPPPSKSQAEASIASC